MCQDNGAPIAFSVRHEVDSRDCLSSRDCHVIHVGEAVVNCRSDTLYSDACPVWWCSCVAVGLC